jgi:bifunctional UDP-N-acetylglucosamine pyrophosphorylase/glucosamine-1-phosphate N-acetyltransferase
VLQPIKAAHNSKTAPMPHLESPHRRYQQKARNFTPNIVMADLNLAVDVVIMAAGKGTRMISRLPKVLHRLAGKPMIGHVVETAASLQVRQLVVVTGHGATEVEQALQTHAQQAQANLPPMSFVRQEPQLGTGHAVQQAMPHVPDDGLVLVLSGDVPLIQAGTLRALMAASEGRQLALLTLDLPDPTGYGRVLRDTQSGTVQAIVEQKDATPEQRAVREVYAGIMVAPAQVLKSCLARLDNRNAQGEFYLTDVVKWAVAQGTNVVGHCITDAVQVAGVNSPAQLADLERAYQRRQAEALMQQGVRLVDPARLDVRGELRCGHDVEIDVNCVFSGRVVLEDGVRIGAHCIISQAHIAAGAVIHPFTHIEGGSANGARVEVGEAALVGPFARLRYGAKLGREVHIGNFVEVKQASLAAGAKANHLAYVGDARIGERVNFGAGSITANYDGAHKHTTVIGADAHIGSNCVLVAPVTIAAGSTVGGGSTITKDTPPDVLTVARARQVSLPHWRRPKKT